MKLCIDCEHCTTKDKPYDTDYRCNNWIDPVTGRRHNVDAFSMRHNSGRCGLEGKLFKRKQSDNPYRVDISELA